MRRFFSVYAVASLLVAMGSMAWAATNLNSSRSNVYRVTHDTAVTATQAAAVLKELDKVGPGATEASVREVLRRLGVNQPNLIVHIMPAGQRRGSERIPLILLLTNPADEPAAIAVSDAGCTKDGKDCSKY